MGWMYIPLGSSLSQIGKGECTIFIKVIHSSLFRRSNFLWGRFILHMGTLIWVDMINIETKLPDFMKLKGIRQSPLPQCVLEITVDHLASTSSGYYMNQFPAIDRTCTCLHSFCPPVVSNVSTNRRLVSSGSGCYGNSFLFLCVSLPIYKTEVTLFLTSWKPSGVEQFPQAFRSIVWAWDFCVYLGTSPQHVQIVWRAVIVWQ